MQFARKIGYLLSFGAFAVYTASRAQSLHFDIEVFTPGGPVLGSPLGVRFFGDQNLLIQGKPPVDAATGRSIWPANFRDFPGGPYSTDDPGFQSFAGVLLRGERLFYRPLESLLYWTPQSQHWSAAAPGTSVRIEGTVPPEVAIGALVHNEPAAQLLYQYYSTPTSITGSGIVGPTTKLIDEASANGSFHTHLNWFLESTGGAGTQPVGAYLLGLQLFDPTGKYRDSAPFYVLFNNGLTTLDYQGAFLSRLDAPTVPPGPVAPPERPPILPPTFPRFTAGSDGELAPLGSPATLSLLTLQSTASFTTARNFNISPEPAAIDTTGFDLSIAGAITATSRLEKTGEGTLTLTGPNTWVVAPLVSQGTLKGPAVSLQTAITNHGTVEFAQSVDATYGHVLSGTGDMRKSGNAVLSLTNINTYTGGTTITGGTLALVNAGSLSPDAPLRLEGGAVFDLSAANGARSAGSIAGAGTIRLGANGLTVGSDRSSTSFSGAIEGTGLFSKVGTGTLDLSGATGHTGTTRIAEGTLLARARSLGSQVVNEGTLVIAESLAVSPLETYGGNISGSGGLVKRGDGALRLRGVNSYAGGTVIEQGMLIGDHISIQGTIVNNGGLAFDQTSDGTFAGAVSGTGMLLKSGSGNLTFSEINSYSGGTRLSGPLTIADDRNLGAVSGGVVINGGTLRTTADIATTRSFALGDTGAVFDTGANTTFAINSNITGPGSLDKIGAGTLQLTGQHTYSGPTTVAQGLLAFRGSLAGSVRVAGGAALAASGVIAGHLDLAPGSIFKVNVDPSAGTDHLALRSATVDGAALEVIAREGEYPLKGRHVVLSAAEQLSGRFGSASSNLAFLRPTLDYDPQNVYLSLERTDATYQSVARTPAQVGVATALGALSRLDSPDARTVIGAVDGLTPESARAAFDSIGGVGRASIVTAQRSSQRALWQQVVARLGAADGGGAGGRAANVALAGFGSLDPWIVSDANPAYAHSLAGAGTASGESEPRDGFWLRGYGGRGRADGAPGAGPTRFDFSGVIAGYDRSIDEQMRFGALAAYSTPEIEQDVLGSRFDGETRQLALYGRYRTGALRIDALAGLADTDTKTTRAVTIGALRRTASASYGGTIATAHIEAGYTFGDTTRLEPIASLQWSYQRDDAYTESGAGALNLAVPRRTMSFLRSTLGINAARDLSSGGMQGMLEARLAWAHEFASQGSLSARFAGDPSNATFSIPTVDVPRDSTIIGLGMSVRATRGLRLYADLAGEFNSAQKLYSVGMGLRYEWENAAPERSSAFWGLRPNSPGPSALLLAESAPVVSPEVKAEGEHEVSADSNAARPESYTHGQEMRHKQGATSLVAASEPVKPGVEVGGKRVASADAQPRPDMRPRSDALRQNKGAAVLLAASEPVELPEIKVEGKREGSADSDARPETRLQGEELRQKQRSTLGATLQDELGVANASFGPSVGLPVIRGFTGPRVRILLDGLGSHDASSVSPDHAITIEPLLAEEVRVMRGPAAVRYGGAAIGGAVEVIDGRIPERIPKNGLAGAAEVRFNSNANEKAQAFKLDAGKQLFALHLDGFNRSRGNTDIPGCAIDEEAIVRQFGLFNATNTCGHVANTDARSHGVTLGASLLDDRSMLGFAIGDLRNNYGIPPGAHSHSHVAGAPPAADAVRIDMKQQRQEAKAAFRFDGPVERLELRAGHVDYEHAELDNNVVQTTFRNEVWEGRAELSHRLAKNLSGTIGGQWIKRDFSALGAEAFVPESAIRSHAGYITQRLNLDPFSFELGARSEYQRIRPEPQRTVFGTTVVLPDTDHTSRSYSAAASLQFAARSSATLTLSRAQRNPDVQELYALGPHLATRTFAVGNNRLNTETVQGADFGLSVDRGTYAGKVNVFGYRVKDFIYQRNAGVFYDPDVRQIRVRCVRLDECLPVQRYEQDDARFTGFEAQFVMRLDVPFGLLEIKPFMDFLRARLEDGTDVPRLPPRRYGLELAFVGEKWSAAIRHTRADAQTRPGVNEAETAGYDQLNAFFEYRLGGRPFETVVFVQGRNLLDNQIRNSVSFLRNYAPEAGRAIEVGLRASF